MRRTTIARVVEWDGLGLHTGVPVRVALQPAPPECGIVFVRTREDSGEEVLIPARHGFLRASSRATTLGLPSPFDASTSPSAEARVDPATRIATVEHLLASLYALEIDDLFVRVDGPEMPALDGSALPIVDRLLEAGRVELPAERVAIRLAEPVEIRDGDRWIRARPADRLGIRYAIDFDHPLIGRQSVDLSQLDAKSFEKDVAGARTFGFVREFEALRAAGLARGASLDNTLVLDEKGLVNEGGLRFRDEFVRHKLIDLLGDLALLGGRLHAQIEVEKGGHTLHHRLVSAILASTG